MPGVSVFVCVGVYTSYTFCSSVVWTGVNSGDRGSILNEKVKSRMHFSSVLYAIYSPSISGFVDHVVSSQYIHVSGETMK